jgi:hypothetical protein
VSFSKSLLGNPVHTKFYNLQFQANSEKVSHQEEEEEEEEREEGEEEVRGREKWAQLLIQLRF